MTKMLPLDDAKFLLLETSRLEHAYTQLAERRLAFIQALSSAVGGQAGFWGWGRGRPLDSTVTPVAALPFGFDRESWPLVVQAGLSHEIEMHFNRPVLKLLTGVGHVCVSRSTVWSDESWYATDVFRGAIQALGLDHFLVFVLYSSEDSWTHLTIFRPKGDPDFSERDLNLVEVGMSSTIWMQPKVVEAISPDAFVGLTPRQRTVMLLLLEGLPRKEIAARLQLTLHTVNDHIKALYERFEVASATELAARFLREQ